MPPDQTTGTSCDDAQRSCPASGARVACPLCAELPECIAPPSTCLVLQVTAQGLLGLSPFVEVMCFISDRTRNRTGRLGGITRPMGKFPAPHPHRPQSHRGSS